MPPTRTRRQKEVLEFITRYIDNHGHEPSYQLIARHLGVSSRGGIVKHIGALEEMGLLKRRREDGSFSLEVIRSQRASLHGHDIEWLYATADDGEREDWELEPISVPTFMLGGLEPSQVYAYRVPDNAMSGMSVYSGDIALIERREYFRDGTCVAVTINNDETILRRYYREGDHIELRSANEEFPSIRIDADKLGIQGLYRGLLRPIS